MDEQQRPGSVPDQSGEAVAGWRMVAPMTGVGQVDDAVAGLDILAELPVDEHVERYDAVHVALRDCLARLDLAGRERD